MTSLRFYVANSGQIGMRSREEKVETVAGYKADSPTRLQKNLDTKGRLVQGSTTVCSLSLVTRMRIGSVTMCIGFGKYVGTCGTIHEEFKRGVKEQNMRMDSAVSPLLLSVISASRHPRLEPRYDVVVYYLPSSGIGPVETK